VSEQGPIISTAPVAVELASLELDGSPRLEGESEAHIRMLADVGGGLPPILVHRQSMRVLDGMHRVRAAILRGDAAIGAVFFDGDADAGFVEAVRANITHGLPLTLADRKAAAQRILRLFPGWSDRAVAAVTGLSAVTLGRVRQRVTEGSGQLPTRVGRDGRRRPLDASGGRGRAAELLAQRPEVSLREVARRAGVSVGTVRDVRRRLRDGLDPVLRPRRGTKTRQTGDRQPSKTATPNTVRAGAVGMPRPPALILAGLRRDPMLRHCERGRAVLGWLQAHLVRVEDLARVVDAVPAHCSYSIAELAAGYAQAWAQIAEELAARGAPAGSQPEQGPKL
jgi:ParB-like chromosome segregation protein Spo0J